MAELKTKENDSSVEQFLKQIDHDKRREDCIRVVDIMKKATGKEPKMWGANIIGFGNYHYKYDSCREGDWFLTGVSPRKQSLSLYILSGFSQYEELLTRLGKYKTGKSCLSVNKLEDVDLKVLEKLIRQSAKHVAKTNG